MGQAQISTCSDTFFQTGEDLILAEDAGLLPNAGAEAEILAHLGNSVTAIEYVERELYYSQEAWQEIDLSRLFLICCLA